MRKAFYFLWIRLTLNRPRLAIFKQGAPTMNRPRLPSHNNHSWFDHDLNQATPLEFIFIVMVVFIITAGAFHMIGVDILNKIHNIIRDVFSYLHYSYLVDLFR